VFTPEPASGRTFLTSRIVRSTDVSPGGRLRFDAVARYLQEAAEDDLTDAGWTPPYGWLLRRCAIAVRDFPARGEAVRLCTFCSATGPRWAERTTTLSGATGDLVQATAVWVAVDRATGDPVPLGADFGRVYGESAQGRQVSARLSLPGPGGAVTGRDWPLRATDFDIAGHVNNTIHWAAVEEVLAGRAGHGQPGGGGWLPAVTELEYHRPILPGLLPRLLTSAEPGSVMLWLMDGTEGDSTESNGSQRLASARLAGAP
jgi:acyl-ACP thioesterase